MVRGMLAKEKISPQKKGSKRRRLVKANGSNHGQEESPPTQQDTHASNEYAVVEQAEQNIVHLVASDEVAADHQIVAVASPVNRRLSLPANREMQKAAYVNDEGAAVGGAAARTKKDKFKRKAVNEVTDDDFEDDVPLTVRKCQLSQQKKKSNVTQKQTVRDDAGFDAKKRKDKGKAKMVDPEPIYSDSEDDARRLLTRKSKKLFTAIKHRGNISVFVEAVQQMNEIQKKEIIGIGFGALLRLNSFEIPRHLCRFLVENYHPRTGKIKLPDGASLEVSEADVEICLGIPRGPAEVVKVDPSIRMDVLEKWREHVGGKLHAIRNDKVAKKMLECSEGGKEFIQDFIVLFHSCLIEPTQSGATNQSLVRSLDRVNRLGSMNWCRFVIKCLVDAKKKWDPNPDACFTGPLIFLTILYLDRVVLYCQRVVPRAFPAFIGWTDGLVAHREKSEISYGVLGEGNVEPQQQIPHHQAPQGRLEDRQTNERVHVASTKQDFNRALGEDLRDLAKVIVKIADKTNKIPEDCKDDEVSKALTKTAMALLGSSEEYLPEEHLGVSSQFGKTLTQSQDPFWTDPELIKMVEEIEAAMTSRNDIIKQEYEEFHQNYNSPLFQDQNLFDQGGASVFEKGGSSRENVAPPADMARDRDDDIQVTVNAHIQPDANKEQQADQGNVIPDVAQPSFSNADPLQAPINPGDVVKDVLQDIVSEHGVAGSSAGVTAVQPVPAPKVASVKQKPKNAPTIPQIPVMEICQAQGDDFVTPLNHPKQKIRRDIKIPASSRSPWYTRIINPTIRSTKEQLHLYEYVTEYAEDEEVLFEYNDTTLTAFDFKSLEESTFVTISIVDLWCVYLNELEGLRSNTSVKRMFVTPSYVIGSIAYAKSRSFETRMVMFKAGMDELVAKVKHASLVDVDLVFYPIFHHTHIYVVCYNFARSTIEIIDNSTSGDADPNGKYGDIVPELTKMFFHYMGLMRTGKRCNCFSNKLPEILKMNWRDANNKVDCGVYAMRHMETYMGQDVKHWETGFKHNSQKNMISLRTKYLHKMISHQMNSLNKVIPAKASRFIAGMKKSSV